jgi:hypothetical protein
MSKKALMAIVLIPLFLFLFSASYAGAVEICESCDDVEDVFNSYSISWLGNVRLGATNTITLSGHQSHGIKSLLVSCEMPCGKLGEKCCYDGVVSAFVCDYNYLKCTAQDESGICAYTCNPGETTQCFTYRNGETIYGEDAVTTGACAPGTAACVDHLWGPCENQVGPFQEICNGIDDDCDGKIDNQWTDDSYPIYTYCCEDGYECGECGMGMKYCFNGNWQDDSQCTSMAYASPELCNGLDDDCDGVIDDVGNGASVEETKCACYNGNANKIETCNGLDDDCNEVIDDVYDVSTCACYNGAHTPGELTESCNSKDDDCNGVIDDQWIGTLGWDWPYYVEYCGMGTPCEGGYWKCNAAKNGVVCSTIGGSNNLAQNETCDNIDNDCDNSVDEGCACAPGNWTYCGLNVGECVQGLQECVSGAWSTQCINYKGPENEICDGSDNDCDNITDNVNGGNSTISTKCRCYNKGTPSAETCNGIDDDCNGRVDDVGSGTSVDSSHCRCYGGIVKPGEKSETCNNIDDDCDGKIDEEWANLGKDCGTGICSGGKFVCSISGNYTVCSTMSSYGMMNATDKTKLEVCNGIDDDCNGIVDDIGGMQSVEDTKCGCYGGKAKASEACNKIDDDCDEGIDEELLCLCFDGQKKACGSPIGECELGEAECTGGVWGRCTGGKGPAEETCNMKDDDCDGAMDNVENGYSIEETRCGCYNNGRPSIEKCDGIDNDCNQVIDDDIDCRCSEGEEMQCGSNVGECTPGMKQCIGGAWGACAGGVLPKPEECNGKDDDCNGVVDDVDGGNSIGSSRCACYNRFAMPSSQDEIFNGIDDDCDGKVDEGFGNVEEPSHCHDNVRNGDETGVDCGGSCKKACPVMPAVNVWIIIFAALVAVIAIFGLFFSSFWKKETKSLFERGRGKRKIISIVLVALLVAVLFAEYNVNRYSGYATVKFAGSEEMPKINQQWTCGNGFQGCTAVSTQDICTPDPYLPMNYNTYNINLQAPAEGNYSCEIRVVSNHFDYSGTQENDERTDVYLNGKLVGTTSDLRCPPGGRNIDVDVCAVEPDCVCSVLLDISMCESKHSVETCNVEPNCCWMYTDQGENADRGCGGVGCCAGKGGVGSPDEYMASVRLCYWDGSKSWCLKKACSNADWQTYKCENYNNQNDCNDYTKHAGLVCCWYGGKCQTDVCPNWYSSRVDGRFAYAKGQCEGTGSDPYVLLPAGACTWDSANPGSVFPCRCASGFSSYTNPDTYVNDRGSECVVTVLK